MTSISATSAAGSAAAPPRSAEALLLDAQAGTRTLHATLWELLFSVTGFREAALDTLRGRDEHADPTPDVHELVTSDIHWTDVDTVHGIRRQLQEYIGALRDLKRENARRASRGTTAKSFVEEKRYVALREREASRRLTSRGIEEQLTSLSLVRRGISSVDASVGRLTALEQLDLRENKLTELVHLPPNAKIVMASGNAIGRVSEAALRSASQLLFLGLSCNTLRSVDFLRASSSLVFVDLSYNGLDDVAHVAQVLQCHSTIREGVFLGNPMTLARNYRPLLAQTTPLVRLDGTSVTEADRTALPPPALPPVADEAEPPAANGHHSREAAAPLSEFDLVLRLVELTGATSLVVPPPPPPPSTAPAADDSLNQQQQPARGGAGVRSGVAGPKESTKRGVEKERPREALAARRFQVAVECCWSGLSLVTPPRECAPPPADTVDAAGGGGGKARGKKGTAATATANAAAAAATAAATAAGTGNDAAQTMQLAVENAAALPITASAVWDLQKPLVARLLVSECGAESRPPRELGRFVANVAAVVERPRGTAVRAVAPLQVSRNTIADMQLALVQQRRALEQMIAADAALDRELRCASTPITPSPPLQQGGGAPETGKRGGGAAGAGAAAGGKGATAKQQQQQQQQQQAALSEELQQLRNDSVARKVEIEELQGRVAYDEVIIERFRAASLTLTVEVMINPYPPPPPPPAPGAADVPPPEAEQGPKAARKKR